MTIEWRQESKKNMTIDGLVVDYGTESSTILGNTDDLLTLKA